MNDPRFTTSPRTHARYWRTAANLSAAAISLAVNTPSTLITVGDIVQHAGVNRSTFYTHAENPTVLLKTALGTALTQTDSVERHIVTHDRRSALQSAIGPVIEHVNQHLAVYRTALTDVAAAGALFHGITEHLTTRICENNPSMNLAGAAAIAGAATEAIRISVARDDVNLHATINILEDALGLQGAN